MPFKVIDGGGPSKEEREREEKKREIERDRERAKVEFSWALRDCAANMLRIIRGAGKPYELLRQMQRALETAIEFQNVNGHWPQDVIANDLEIKDPVEKERMRVKDGNLDQASYDRCWENGRFDRLLAEEHMYRGALRAIAAQLIGQDLQQTAGEREFHDGLAALDRAREKQQKAIREEMRPAKGPALKARKPIDLGPGPKDEDKLRNRAEEQGSNDAEPKHRNRSRKFDQADLRELKRAIKANDKKKIAELRAKIGRSD